MLDLPTSQVRRIISQGRPEMFIMSCMLCLCVLYNINTPHTITFLLTVPFHHCVRIAVTWANAYDIVDFQYKLL